MAILVRNKSAGFLTIPAAYGKGEIAPGGAFVVNDTEANVTAAFSGVTPGYLEFTSVPDNQSGSLPTGQSPAFPAARTLYVSQSWSSEADPLVFFTSIAAAEAQAATMAPTSTNAVGVIVYPGTYAGAVTKVSNVHWLGVDEGGVFFSGAITWLAGQGVNAGSAAVLEQVIVENIQFTGAWSIDSTAKTASRVIFVLDLCVANGVTFTANPTATDNVLAFVDNFQTNSYTWTNVNVLDIWGGRVRGMTFAGNTNMTCDGAKVFQAGATQVFTGTSTGHYSGCTRSIPITVASGCNVVETGCDSTASTITVAAGGNADERASNYGSNANLIGPGTINRQFNGSFAGPSAVGANPVTFAVPLPVGQPYVVKLQRTAGPGGSNEAVTVKTNTGFTFTDAAGGNAFDFSVTPDGM